jgi:radical SAM superfamily enzyme YgiQ (UPF0313 family)
MNSLRVVLIKPSKYAPDGVVQRFRRGFMPNATLAHMRSLTPRDVAGRAVEVECVDEYVETDLAYLDRIGGSDTLLALVGVQSHQLHRALDLAALARKRGARGVVIGGPHAMTCDTRALQGRGVSFALAEGELIWQQILEDAVRGELDDTYGAEARWQTELASPAIIPPAQRDLARHVIPMLGIYPARGCPYRCNFCSVIKIAGQRVRSEPVSTTLASLRAAKAAGVKVLMFTSDNFNKYAAAPELLRAMIDEKIDIPFFVQCDTQVAKQEELVELLGRAGCFQMFLGIESLDRATLERAHKTQNHPERYGDIVALAHRHDIEVHFSNILGFPDDTEASIESHLRAMFALGADVASFYILTPIPGTEQYVEMKRDGLLTEQNLDRYDAISLCWRHPHLDERTLRRLMWSAYREFYSPRRNFACGRYWFAKTGTVPPFGIPIFAIASTFHWLSAVRGIHPMSGGLGRVTRDRAVDYAHLRRAVFDVERAALPDALPLPAASVAFNHGLPVVA